MSWTEEEGYALWLKLTEMFRDKFRIEWMSAQPHPDHFDHWIDILVWRTQKFPIFAERGIFSLNVIPRGATVLDLACGDGSYPAMFYSNVASHILAVDIGKPAIEHAKKWHSRDNIEYRVEDILKFDPQKTFDVVILNAAVEHFVLDDIVRVVQKCKAWTAPGGVFCGSSIQRNGPLVHSQHGYEFSSIQEVGELMKRVGGWAHTFVRDTSYTPERVNLYWRCSDKEDRIKDFYEV